MKLRGATRGIANLKYRIRDVERETAEEKRKEVKKFVEHIRGKVLPDYLRDNQCFGYYRKKKKNKERRK